MLSLGWLLGPATDSPEVQALLVRAAEAAALMTAVAHCGMKGDPEEVQAMKRAAANLQRAIRQVEGRD